MKWDDLKPHPNFYFAFALSRESRALLLKRFPPKFSKVFCDHVTLEFNLTDAKLEEMKEMLLLNDEVKVTGYVSGENAQGHGVECFTVTVGGEAQRKDKSFYHVTLSVEPPAKPVNSNQLLLDVKGESQRKLHIVLDGEFKLLKK